MHIDTKFGSPSSISLGDIVVHTDKKDLFMPFKSLQRIKTLQAYKYWVYKIETISVR